MNTTTTSATQRRTTSEWSPFAHGVTPLGKRVERWFPGAVADDWLYLDADGTMHRRRDNAARCARAVHRVAQCRDDGMGPHWRPSIYMPRWASRITLEVTEVRQERLHSISAADAVAEGVSKSAIERWEQWIDPRDAPGQAFAEIWIMTNGERTGAAWVSNPLVTVVTFRVHRCNIDALAVISSWGKDAGTFGSIGLLAWFNHTHLGGTWVLDVLAVVFVCGMMVRAFSSRVATVTENELVAWAVARALRLDDPTIKESLIVRSEERR